MPNPSTSRPEPAEYAPEFGQYIRLVPDGDILNILDLQLGELLLLPRDVSEAESLRRHAPYTWSIRQVVGHLCDCERVFSYRALRLARNDATPMERFDQNKFVQEANFDKWPLAD